MTPDQKVLGPAFTTEVREAWVAVFNVPSAEMQRGLAEASMSAIA